MNRLIDKKLIVLDSPAADKKEAMQQMVTCTLENCYIRDTDVFVQALEDREKEFSTAIGFDVAIPHGRTETVVQPFVMFMRVTEPLKWDNTENSVTLIFMLGVPANHQDSNLHLQVLAALSRKLMHENFRNIFRHGSLDEVYAQLVDVELLATQQ